MNLNQQLIEKIKQASGTTRQDTVNYVVCEVLPQQSGDYVGQNYNQDDLTICCKTISDKSIESIDPNDVTDFSPLLQEQKGNLINYNLGSNILINVNLMASVDDGILLVPSIGSHVIVANSTYQNPFVVQYSNIDIVYMDLNTNYNINIQDPTDGGDSNNSSVIIECGTMSFGVQSNDASNSTIIQLTNQTANLTILNGASVVMDTKFNLLANNGANIIGDDKLTIKSQSGDLKTTLNDIVAALNKVATALQDISVLTIVTTSAAGTWPISPATLPTITSAIAQVNASISTLNSDISNLMS